jgi:hypothetical protein
MNRQEQKQNAYLQARKEGHSKSDAKLIRSNWNSSNSSDDSTVETGWSECWQTKAYNAETELNRKYYESLDPSHPDYRDLD